MGIQSHLICLRSLAAAGLALLTATSCQVPSSLRLGTSSLHSNGGTANGQFVLPLTAGLTEPTWDKFSPPTPKLTTPGWDRVVDHTYFSIKTSENVIAITFDDGPHGVNTPRQLDVLKERKIKATFYVVGNMVKYNPQILRRMIEEGHEIGNHTVTHDNLARKSNEGLLKELRSAHDLIEKETGIAPRTMRPPGGAISTDQKKLMLEELSYPTILWSVDPEDWKKPGASVVTSRLLNGARPGGILLVHDLHKATVDAMPATLDGLLAKGYKFVTVTELIMMDENGREEE